MCAGAREPKCSKDLSSQRREVEKWAKVGKAETASQPQKKSKSSKAKEAEM